LFSSWSCARADLVAVPLPDLSRSDPPVQAQLRDAYAAVTHSAQEEAPGDALGHRYADLAMLLHAAEYWGAAEAAYLNAQTLLPDDARWPYYLGHVFRQAGSPEKSLAAFTRALELRPSDVPTLVWLSRTYTDLGRATEAQALLERARSIDPRAAAVVAGLGQAALARGDSAGAVRLFEEALSIDPQAKSVHAPLASAYQALGDAAKAEMHRRLWRDVDVPLADPLLGHLSSILRSAVSYEVRGVRAFDTGNWSEAAKIFREGLTLTAPETPVGRALRHKLGIALYLGGEPAAGIREFEEAVRLAPQEGHDEPAGRAHYSLGIIMGSSGRDDRAVEHLSRAVAYDATSLPAHVALADALRRLRRDEAALAHYRQGVAIDPQAAEARLGYALALVRLRRYTDALTWLEEAVRAQPDRPELAHALARLLATAPDPRVRDAERAGEIVGELFKTSKRTEVGETMAMALAELGYFDEAQGIQRGVLDAAQRAGLRDDVNRMTTNLRLFERRQPVRTPWPDDDPIHRPGPPVSPRLAALVGR
jgi:tetratricopeptide (TPR) repeat protein